MIETDNKSRQRADSKKYYAALGAQLARMRQSEGYTQVELARRIGVSQQAVFAYEIGDRRPSVLILMKIAGVFRVGIEDLATLGQPLRLPRSRMSPRAQRHAERLQALPKTQQCFVIKIIDNLERGNGAVVANHKDALLASTHVTPIEDEFHSRNCSLASHQSSS